VVDRWLGPVVIGDHDGDHAAVHHCREPGWQRPEASDAGVVGMAWVHDTGYGPADTHAGYPVSVLADGSETGTVSVRVAAQVIGWRAACDCGWRGPQFYPRAEWAQP
jgi:hypothetical protein